MIVDFRDCHFHNKTFYIIFILPVYWKPLLPWKESSTQVSLAASSVSLGSNKSNFAASEEINKKYSHFAGLLILGEIFEVHENSISFYSFQDVGIGFVTLHGASTLSKNLYRKNFNWLIFLLKLNLFCANSKVRSHRFLSKLVVL